MASAIQAYPLAWPVGWKRTPVQDRKYGQFNKKETKFENGNSWQKLANLTVNDGVGRIITCLERMGVDRQDLIISTNVRVRLDGLPRSGEREPDDPGAAIYWKKDATSPMRSMAIDRYTVVADNLAALAATLEAMRAIERHGGAEILDRTFSGFKALNAENAGPSWWSVLQVWPEASAEQIERAFKVGLQFAHPDKPGGSHEAMAALNAARDQALAAAKGRS